MQDNPVQDDLHIYLFNSVLGLSSVPEPGMQMRSWDAKILKEAAKVNFYFILFCLILFWFFILVFLWTGA